MNKEELSDLLIYANLAGKLAQRLYYNYSDTELLNDVQYDAMCIILGKLFKKYPKESPVIRFTDTVGN